MTTFKSTLIAISIAALLVSCGNRQTDNSETTQEETPEALQDSKFEIKRYISSEDLTEELYQELVAQTPALKKLEDDLEALGPKPAEIKDKFNRYDGKSGDYYRAANASVVAISDSLLKNKMLALITVSNEKYAGKTAELNSLVQQIAVNEMTLNDYRTVLKIVLTLALIEKYQNDHKPGKEAFKSLIEEQARLISRTDSLTPNY